MSATESQIYNMLEDMRATENYTVADMIATASEQGVNPALLANVLTTQYEGIPRDLAEQAIQDIYGEQQTTPPAAAVAPAYREASAYSSPGKYQRLAEGDYEALQKALYEGAVAGLTNQEKTWRDQADQSLANRGLWSSGIAQRSQNDITERLAPMYQQAGANAVSTRYGMQQADNQGESSFNLSNAGMENNYNLTSAQNYNNWAQGMYGLQNQYALGNKQADDYYALQRASLLNTANAQAAQAQWQALWEPATYMAGLWNGTNGVISSGSSGGFSI